MQIFEDTQTAFDRYSDRKLTKAYWLFRLFSHSWLVSIAKIKLKIAFVLGLPIEGIIRNTVFSHFCGGETLESSLPVVEELGQRNVKSILDFSVESSSEEKDIVANMLETQRSIRVASSHANVAFAVFKPTAFAHPDLLEKAACQTLQSEDEKAAVLKYENRITQLCQTAYNDGISILIDAEEARYQPYIDALCEKMMLQFNRNKPIIFNTLQMYRTDRVDYLKKLIAFARENKVYAGVKLVRGAYLEQERQRAVKQGIASPVHADKEATDNAFNEALRISTNNIDVLSIFCGTHNEVSIGLLMKLMDERGIVLNDKRVFFSQLFGMSDNISFNLAKYGYNVAKYIPYGPVREVLPYLIRRAEENTSVGKQTGRELQLIRKEIYRRRSEKEK
jgi:proline dehydrogenase